jgi:hypothetical protein
MTGRTGYEIHEGSKILAARRAEKIRQLAREALTLLYGKRAA